MNEIELKNLINKGEGHHIEFKLEEEKNKDFAKTIVSFTNTDGGKVLIGVKDDGTIVGVSNPDLIMQRIGNIAYNNCEPPITIIQETANIDDKTIIIVNVPKGTQRPYRTNEGKYYVRSSNSCRDASREELLRIFQSSKSIFYDETPVNTASTADFQFEQFRSFIIDYLSLEIEDKSELLNFAKNFHLLNTSDNNHNPTVTGILFFGKFPQSFLPQARIICAAIKGTDVAIEPFDKKEIAGTIPAIIEDVERFFKIHLQTKHKIEDFKKEVFEELPLTALREAAINAIAHRDYTINSPVRIIIYSDRIEIRSPGTLPNTVTIESIKVGGSHVLRNPNIYNMLAKYKMVTDVGSGVRRMIKLIKEHTGKEPLLEVLNSEFVVTIQRYIVSP